MCKTKKELNKLVEKLRAAKIAKAQLEAEIDSLQTDIIEYVLKHGVLDDTKKSRPLVVLGDTYKLSYGDRIRTDMDREKLKDLLGKSYDLYVITKSYKQLDLR